MEWKELPSRGLGMCQVPELCSVPAKGCCYTEGSATSPKVLISRLVKMQRTVMWRALTLVRTLRQLFPAAPHGTESREEQDVAASSSTQQQAAKTPAGGR